MGGQRRGTAADGPRREPPVATAGWLPGLPADLAAAAPGRMVVCCRRPGRPAHDSQRDGPGRAFVAAPVHLPAARRHRGERVTGPVTVDIAGAQMGGAARYTAELYGYLARTGRDDVQVIGATRRVDPAWLLRREMSKPGGARRVALNNVSFVGPGAERWTLLGNALHFLTESETSRLDPSRRAPGRPAIGRARHTLLGHGRARHPDPAWRERARRRAPAPGLGRRDPAAPPRYGHPVPSAVRAIQAHDTATHRTARGH